MRRRTKLNKKTIPCPKVTQELIDIEAAICSSHREENLPDESRAVAKIKEDPKYFVDLPKKLVSRWYWKNTSHTSQY